jgi:Stress responsive A/B Barrel Domain
MTHVVMYQLSDPDDAAQAVRFLRSMAGRIQSLRCVRAGTDSRADTGAHDVVLITEHDDTAGLEAYLTDPVHLEVAGWIRPRVASRAVVDSVDLA